MSEWPIKEVGLDELDLDLRNVRIPGGDLDESAIANYLVEAADLLELARNILRDGYIDNEIPVVVAERSRHVVLEGNRRITALKAIHDPSLLGKSAPRMERLTSRYPESGTPNRIRVMIAPSREAVQPLLARLHTRNPKKSWIREQQAVFYHAQLSPTMTVDDLRTIYPGEAPSIPSFIRMGEMREVIRGLRYDDAELEEFVKTSQLKMTTFEYAYERPRIQQVLSLEFNRDGLLESKRLNDSQCRGLMYLLERFKAGTLNTRSPELKARSSEHEVLVEQLRRVVASETGAMASAVPDSPFATGTHDRSSPAGEAIAAPSSPGDSEMTRGQGAATEATTTVRADTAASTPSNESTRGPNRGETRSRLNLDGFEYDGTSPGLRRRFEELKRLDVRDFPNAAHDLLRTVLECAIKDYFSYKGRSLAGATLGNCINELSKEYQNDRRMTSFINVINRRGRMPADQFAGTAVSLNASNHEPDSFVTGPDVHEAWERLKPILIEIVGKS